MLQVNWDESLCNDNEWKCVIINYNNNIFDIILHRFGYIDYSFFYETNCDISLKDKNIIEKYLIEYFKNKW